MKWSFDPCQRHRQNISLLAASALSETEKVTVDNHLVACADCRKYFEEVKAVTVPLANLAGSVPQLQPSQSAQARWSRAIREAGRLEPVRRFTPAMALREWWRDVIWPRRRVWTGLAAIWVIILMGNLSLPNPAQKLAGKSSPQEMIAALKDQQKILAELMTIHSGPSEAEPEKIYSPKPRTEGRMILTA